MANNFTFRDFDSGDSRIGKSTETATVHVPHHNVDIIAAGETHVGEVGVARDVIDVTLTLDTSPYAAADVLSDTATMTNAVRVSAGKTVLKSITVIDEDDQGQAFDIFFFKVTQSLGTKNSPPSITDTQARDCLGFIKIETADYSDLGGVQIATKNNLALVLEANTAATSIFIGTICRSGTPTYTANGIKLKLGVEHS